jgi:exonuclease SbcD
LRFASRLLYDRHLFLCGAFDGGMHKVVLPDDYGEVAFWLLPFIKPALFESYDDALRVVLDAADIDYAARNVLLSHQFYAKPGVAALRSESELNPIGGLDAVDAGLIERFDYAALGHLHRSQHVGAAHIRYCGSPVKYSFSEWRWEKTVTVVDLNKKGSLSVTTRPLTPIHDMREIKGEIGTLTGREAAAIAGADDYLRVVLTDTEEIIDPMGKLRSVYPNIMSLDFENPRTGIHTDAVFAEAQTMESLSAYELFDEFFLETQGAAMSDEQAAIVRKLLEGPEE